MCRNVTITVFAVVLLICSLSWADSEAPPYAYVVVADGGRFYFKMVPDPKDKYDRDKGSGTAFAVNGNGQDKVLWKTSGWYSFVTYISRDGKYLVRIGNWPRRDGPSEEHLGIAFYKEGKLLRSYSTKDLIKDVSLVPHSVSHYRFLQEIIGFEPSFSLRFVIKTVDNIEYVFDARNGKITSQEHIEDN